MAKDSNSTAPLEGAVETTTNEVVDNSKTVEVKFLLSPTAKFGLAYAEGEIGFFSEEQANELVGAKYAEFVK
jgi:hypothetical protein